MAWFEFHSNTKSDPRIGNLRRAIRLTRPLAVGHIALLRAWMAENERAFTGELAAFTPEEIAEGADYIGDPVELVHGLIEAGFLSRDPDAAPIAAGELLEGHTNMVGWIDICGEATKKKIGRLQSPDLSKKNAETLESLIFGKNKELKDENPVWSLYLVYKYLKRGKDKALVHDEKWDKLNASRQMAWIRKILQDGFDGDLRKAANAVIEIGDYFERLSLVWDASTIHKRLTDWQENRLGR